MKIILMRHGEAKRLSTTDSERQLTDFGHEQAAETAKYLIDNYNFDAFVVSPYDRAQQTLAAVTKQCPEVPISVHNDIIPEADAMTALSSLADVTGDCILVVCHMPIVAKLAALLTGTDPISYDLAEARVIECDFVAADMGEQLDKYIPKQS